MSEPKTYWLDNSKNVTTLFRGLCVVCMALFAIDLFLHRHEEFGFATLLGFHSLYGFVACVVLVLIAKQLRRILMRDENYYDR